MSEATSWLRLLGGAHPLPPGPVSLALQGSWLWAWPSAQQAPHKYSVCPGLSVCSQATPSADPLVPMLSAVHPLGLPPTVILLPVSTLLLCPTSAEPSASLPPFLGAIGLSLLLGACLPVWGSPCGSLGLPQWPPGLSVVEGLRPGWVVLARAASGAAFSVQAHACSGPACAQEPSQAESPYGFLGRPGLRGRRKEGLEARKGAQLL